LRHLGISRNEFNRIDLEASGGEEGGVVGWSGEEPRIEFGRVEIVRSRGEDLMEVGSDT